ncbi:hypothetical protein Zmor_027754 [Zophobas morio]|uniref:Major facilitator superfamily (MFS) profile domain-containing protein n=1 Tax=Zophobas morio TaxID=2755281 RepID=A0AA38HPX2_9CUCU|nr:hypothetical protein Zmor_027754 [Zophobas morio]
MILPILYIVSTLDAFCFVLVITALNPYVYSLGGTQFYLGVLSSVSSFINLIWNPIVGSLSDTLGRKTVLLQCLLICLVGNIMTAATSSLHLFFISRIVTTFGVQIATLLKALVDDNIQTEEAKMAAINRMQALGGACFIFASLVSGYMSELENGFKYIFYLISAVFFVNLVLMSIIPNTHPKVTKTKDKPKQGFNVLEVVKKATANLTKVDWPKYWDLFTIKLLTDFVFMVFHFNLTEMLLRRFGITGKAYGYVFASISVTSILVTLTMSKLKQYFYSDDKSGLKRLLHGCILFIVAFLGLGLSASFATFYIFLIPTSISRVLLESTFIEVILARAAPQEKGTIMGTFDTTLALSGLTAPLFSGLVSDTWGAETCMLLCTVPLAFATTLAYSQRKRKLQ